MGLFDNPFSSATQLSHCACGRHASSAEHDAAVARDRAAVISSDDGRVTRVVENAVIRALFPQDASRRAFLRAVGTGTAAAAISQFLPIGMISETLAQGTGPLEKTDLNVGFIPITCA